eukprot:CAMPEP_0180215490 /NCGR_PEP_ID=MMETSP0987-20121128/15556_1 /TAXON_ID=697907 /ORGANISM="non described non described, Strain CCMP2293" /LENGTH=314 /DNA_ID=CAMNT_0022174217 /DNA_START=92 /DNA_END=1036 /DNA_ORIENTATION=-
MTVSDLCIADHQAHPDVEPLKRLYEFRSRRQRSDSELEDMVDLRIGDAMPPPVEMESILLRFFRPNPNLMEQLREVGDFMRDEELKEEDAEHTCCDFCDMPLACDRDPDLPPLMNGHGNSSPECSGVWATRLPCGHLFHRECIRLVLSEDAACPAPECDHEFEGHEAVRDSDSDVDDQAVSGLTYTFLCENRSLWLRMASIIQHFQEVDNLAQASANHAPPPAEQDRIDAFPGGLEQHPGLLAANNGSKPVAEQNGSKPVAQENGSKPVAADTADGDAGGVEPLKRLYEFRSRRQRSDSELEAPLRPKTVNETH